MERQNLNFRRYNYYIEIPIKFIDDHKQQIVVKLLAMNEVNIKKLILFLHQ